MTKANEIRTGRHCVFNLHVHLVFVTKYRRRIFTKAILDRLRSVLQTVCSDFDAEMIEFDGENDHVHLLINYAPKVPISKLVNSLKGVSSRLLRKEFPELSKHYYNGVLWSPSYFAASCGGAPIEIIKQYIQNQNSPN
jgi:putative transposase